MNSHKQLVVERFSHWAHEYDQHAVAQGRIAARLARALPVLRRADILEIGCGTGLFTGHLLDCYLDADFLITDLSQRMLDQCELNFPARTKLRYGVMDGERPFDAQRYDLIVSNMTVQWFEAPDKSLAQLKALLKPGGHLLYSTIGPNLFPQWRAVLAELDLPCGLVDVADLPGEISEDTYRMQFDSGLDFLQSLKKSGASTPRPDYRGLSAGQLRRAMRLFERKMGACADWHILYGHMRG